MMNEEGKNRTISIIDRCIKTLKLAIEGFQDFLGSRTSSDPEKYSQANKYFEEGKTYNQEASREISGLFGSIPEDATSGFKKWKESFLNGLGIISESKEFEALRSELRNDDFLLRFFSAEEIDVHFKKRHESQRMGKRKLENIKARIILDEIGGLMAEAETLSAKSKEKLYQLR